MFVESPTQRMLGMSVSALARQLGVPPVAITRLFYCRRIPDHLAPIVGNKRQIPESLIPRIESLLREQGKLPNAVADADEAATTGA